jgi:adenosylcobinamide kinase/adenosylcobinamide-phosphate guanylyltransferase
VSGQAAPDPALGAPSAARLILVSGGLRSGKSRFAERLAIRLGGPVLYVATARPGDDEMVARIAAHRARRPPEWQTLEVARDLSAAVAASVGDWPSVLVDDLGFLVTNLLLADDSATATGGMHAPEARLEAELDSLIQAAARGPRRWIVVTNEVGSGMVPLTPLGRTFADLLGRANQRLARHADVVYLVVSGIAFPVSAFGERVE